MSREGGRGGWRGRGRGGRGSAMPPMGLSFADLASLSRESTALYPSMDPLPVLSQITPSELEDMKNQQDFERQMRASPYYIVESKKSTDIPRYSDKYRPNLNTLPSLKRSQLNPEFFPSGIFEAYFNPKKKGKVEKKAKKVRANFDALEREELQGEVEEDDDDDKPKDDDEEPPDYDEDGEDDNDYVEEYFDNGEGDDDDNLGGPRGGDDGGGDTYE